MLLIIAFTQFDDCEELGKRYNPKQIISFILTKQMEMKKMPKTVRQQMIEQAIKNCNRLSRNIIKPIAQAMSTQEIKYYVPISERKGENALDNFYKELR